VNDHRPTRPSADAAVGTDVFDVAIVGLGPVGATAANLLGQRGIRTFACDRSTSIYPLPRALGLDHETMRILQACDLADDVQRFVRVYPRTEYRGVDGRLISQFESIPEPFPLGWAPNYTFNQPEFERILRAGIDRYPCVEVVLGAEASTLTEHDDDVLLHINRVDGGETREVRARFVIAADGGGSPIRRQLGIGMESLDFDEPWIVIDIICDDDAARVLPDCVIQYCEPDRPTTYVLGPGNHRRWEMMLLPGEDAATIATEARVWELLARWIAPDHAELWRFATYVFHSLIATSWRHGRVFLAGDAAHMTPPFMAQGMVQGLRDVLNLTWKLDLVLHGADATMLDSYETEREPHVRATSEAAKALGHVICELDADRARQRDERMLAEFGDPPKVRLRQNLIPGLSAGLVDLASTAAGRIAPQPTVHTAAGGAQRLDDVTGPGFRLVAGHRLAGQLLASPTVSAVIEQLDGSVVAVHPAATFDDVPPARDDRLVTVSDRAGTLDEWFRANGCAAVLVRPDHYVYGTADDVESVERLCAQAVIDCGLAPPTSPVPSYTTGGSPRART
jgi:3-(3-hydroxy-phenyl)propionate hydroxylase